MLKFIPIVVFLFAVSCGETPEKTTTPTSTTIQDSSLLPSAYQPSSGTDFSQAEIETPAQPDATTFVDPLADYNSTDTGNTGILDTLNLGSGTIINKIKENRANGDGFFGLGILGQK